MHLKLIVSNIERLKFTNFYHAWTAAKAKKQTIKLFPYFILQIIIIVGLKDVI